MIRLNVVGALLIGLCFSAQSAWAIEWWHDPARGCGTLDGWLRTSRLKDLPGCDGELPKGAPPGEIAMHDAKKALHEAEKLLDTGQTTEVEAKLDTATNIMNKAPNDPRVNWARPHYAKALAILRAKLAIVPRMPKLRTAYKAAVDAADQANKLKTDAARKAALAAADACVQAFRDAESQGVDLSVPVELTAGKARPLREDQKECASGKTSQAEPVAAAPPPDKPAEPAKPEKPEATPDKPVVKAAGGSDGGVPRAKWLKALKGDRKKVFAEHPDAFPEFDGEPGPKGAIKAAEWRYGSEVFQFKRNKLVKPKKGK
jgi:hypothetical protein